MQQLGYEKADTFNEENLKKIMNKTSHLINKTFSVKYIGVIEGNMGILSRRLRLAAETKRKTASSNFPSKKNHFGKEEGKKQNRLTEDEAFPKPELHDNYMVSQYALPNSLKPIKKQRDEGKE